MLKYFPDIMSSEPKQLSTYALTRFEYRTNVDNKDVRVGKCKQSTQINPRVILVAKRGAPVPPVMGAIDYLI